MRLHRNLTNAHTTAAFGLCVFLYAPISVQCHVNLPVLLPALCVMHASACFLKDIGL